MFNQLGQLAGLLRHLPKLQAEMEQFQQRLSQVTAEGSAGGGLVKARVNGHFLLTSCSLSEEALQLKDREMLEDLIQAAVNQAQERARQLVHEEAGKLAAGLGLPPDLGLPGLTGLSGS